MNLNDLSADHDYYASDSNYYSNEAGEEYDNWASFHEEYGDADIDMNLIMRWDINAADDTPCLYYMQITMIKQRKGIYCPIRIKEVTDKDVDQIVAFMKPHFEKLIKIWKPLSAIFLKNKSNGGDE